MYDRYLFLLLHLLKTELNSKNSTKQPHKYVICWLRVWCSTRLTRIKMISLTRTRKTVYGPIRRIVIFLGGISQTFSMKIYLIPLKFLCISILGPQTVVFIMEMGVWRLKGYWMLICYIFAVDIKLIPDPPFWQDPKYNEGICNATRD